MDLTKQVNMVNILSRISPIISKYADIESPFKLYYIKRPMDEPTSE